MRVDPEARANDQGRRSPTRNVDVYRIAPEPPKPWSNCRSQAGLADLGFHRRAFVGRLKFLCACAGMKPWKTALALALLGVVVEAGVSALGG